MNNVTAEVNKHMLRALNLYRARGAPLPYLLVATGINGITTVFRYTEREGGGLKAEPLVYEAGVELEMQFPVNMMLIDAAGEAAHISIKQDQDDAVVRFWP